MFQVDALETLLSVITHRHQTQTRRAQNIGHVPKGDVADRHPCAVVEYTCHFELCAMKYADGSVDLTAITSVWQTRHDSRSSICFRVQLTTEALEAWSCTVSHIRHVRWAGTLLGIASRLTDRKRERALALPPARAYVRILPLTTSLPRRQYQPSHTKSARVQGPPSSPSSTDR